METSLGLSIMLLVITFGVIGGFIFKFWWDEQKAAKRRREILEMAAGENRERVEQNENGSRRPQRRRFANQRRADENENEPEIVDGHDSDGIGDVAGEDSKKMGKKKLAKLQAKAEAKAKRETEQIERAERRKRDEEKARADEEKRRAEEDEERKRLERLAAEREEHKRREREEYEKLKASFAVEEAGFDHDPSADKAEKGENQLREFVETVRNAKVVYMDELATCFSLCVDECAERIRSMVADGILDGVMDDRGKFIYITSDEFEAVAKFIKQRGRVSVQELADYSNRLISFDPMHVPSTGFITVQGDQQAARTIFELEMSSRADVQTVKQARSVVEQLRRERAIPRGKVSNSANEIVRYTQEAQKDDYLLNGFPTDKLNPYRTKNAIQCLVL